MVFCVVCLWSDSEIGQIWMNLFDRVKINFFCLHIYCLSASVQYSFLFYSFGCFNNIIYNQTTRKGELTILVFDCKFADSFFYFADSVLFNFCFTSLQSVYLGVPEEYMHCFNVFDEISKFFFR